MALRVEEIADAALALPSEDRAILADRLLQNLDPAEESDFHVLWANEANRRLEEVRSGVVKTIPGEEAMERIRQKYGG